MPRRTSFQDQMPLIHQYTGAESDALANAFLIETDTGVVVVDGLMTVPEAKGLRARLESLKKPLLGVIVTHGHPDHYGGVAEVVAGKAGVPIYATEGVFRFLKAADEQIGKTLKSYGIPFADTRALPNRAVKDGESVTLGGLRLTALELGPGESNADAAWVLEGAQRVAFIGDCAANQTHVYLADGHSGTLLQNLSAVKKKIGRVALYYPGHGAPGRGEIFDWTRKYVETFRKQVLALSAGSGKLSEAQKSELARRMARFVPGNRLPQFVYYGADAVAAELATKK